MSSSPLRRRIWIGGAMVALLALVAALIVMLNTWADVNRVSIERPEGDGSGGPVAQDEPESKEEEEEVTEPTFVTGRQIFLLVGSDSREDLEDTTGFGVFEGNRADVVMVLVKDNTDTAVLSLPRDLLVEDPCLGADRRINEMLEGCPDMNGPTLLTLAVEKLIGQSIDHFGLVDLAGFQEAVDALGGYEICVTNPVRDERANLSLPGGCTVADGAQTLAWLRSRRTQELTEDGWRTIPGVNDLARNERQRKFLIDMMGRIADISSPQAITSAARSVAPFVTVDSDLSLMDAVNLAWTLRGLGTERIVELEVPVHDATTASGASVLRPSRPVDEIVTEFLNSSASADSGGGVLDVQG